MAAIPGTSATGGLVPPQLLQSWVVPTEGLLTAAYVTHRQPAVGAVAPSTFVRLLSTLPRVLALTNSVDEVRPYTFFLLATYESSRGRGDAYSERCESSR